MVGLIESRGLCFDRLFVPGMTATALPRPVRALPLLSADERRHVRGGTAQSERAFSQAAFGNMLACADAVALSRPLTSGREPLAASPFWPTHVETEAPDLRFWASPDRAWLNAGWVEQAWRGLGQAPQGDQEGLALGVLPDELAATAVESLLRCPLGFLVKNLLKLGPLEDPQPGIDARKRGSIVHEILERFVNVVRAQKLDLIAHAPQCEGLLRKTASAVIDEQGGGWAWDVERRRLVGHAGAGDNGLLGKWLVKQREWWQQGWRFCATEVEFRGVELEGVPFRIRGSINRVDEHPDEGLRVWDYKAGSAPDNREVTRNHVRLQIVQYLAAVKAGAGTRGDGSEAGAEQRAAAGFWQLRSEKDVQPKLHKHDAAFWDAVLAGFTSLLERVANEAVHGRYPAEPVPGDPGDELAVAKVCEYCGAKAFCVPAEGSEGACATESARAGE